MKYLLLFSIVMSLYIKRNPHIQSICWQDMRIEFQGGDSSHEIFFYFSFCSSPLRYLNCKFDAEAKGQSISKCLFGVFNFFNKTNENTSHSSKNEFIRSFFGRVHCLIICFQNYNGAKLFNMLPLEMKKMEDPNIFKTKTKEWIWENIPSY